MLYFLFRNVVVDLTRQSLHNVLQHFTQHFSFLSKKISCNNARPQIREVALIVD